MLPKSYQILSALLNQLQGNMVNTVDIFKKGVENKSLVADAKKFSDETAKVEQIGNEIFKNFTELKKSYDNGSMVLTRYVERLKDFKTFFEQNNVFNVLPDSLQAGVIKAEVIKFVG